MSDIEDAIRGTPAEELKKDADTLRRFKTLDGYKVLVKYVREQEASLLRLFMSDTVTDEKQLRADCRAWHGVLQGLDGKIENYDIWLEQTIKMQKHQEQLLKGINNDR